MKPEYTYAAKVLRVIDGDTAVLNIDTGFRMWAIMPIRLYGINAPERGKEGWSESKAYLELLVGTGEVIVKVFRNPEKYGRWLGIIYVGEQNINAAMVINKMAVFTTYKYGNDL